MSLRESNIELILVYGRMTKGEYTKDDERELDWAIFRENRIFKLGNHELIYQSCLDLINDVDLIIVEQANRLLTNYLLMIMSKFGKFKFAYWGHGSNLQMNENGFWNRFKTLFLGISDHWFAYTDGTRKFLLSKGIPDMKITVVNNAIDTEELRELYKTISDEEINSVKEKLNLSGDNIGLYCGALYKEKRIEFLIESIQLIKQEVPDFQFIFLGGGPDSDLVRKEANKRSWIHYCGPKFDHEKIPYFKLSKVFLLPGAVGLAILDSFATETPMITTDYSFHGPEVEYIVNNQNGIISKNEIGSFASEVVNLMNNDNVLERLRNGCRESSLEYTNDKMVEKFKIGVKKCLEH